jgi:hypothetical protein
MGFYDIEDHAGRTLFSPVIGNLTIEGNGATLERTDNAEIFRFFNVVPGAHLTLRNVMLRGGLLEEGKGAAILNQGTLTLDNVTFENNCLVNDPCSEDDAVYNDGGTVNVIDAVIYNVGTALPPTSTQTPTPTPTASITPIVVNAGTPIALPTRITTQTPTPTSAP